MNIQIVIAEGTIIATATEMEKTPESGKSNAVLIFETMVPAVEQADLKRHFAAAASP